MIGLKKPSRGNVYHAFAFDKPIFGCAPALLCNGCHGLFIRNSSFRQQTASHDTISVGVLYGKSGSIGLMMKERMYTLGVIINICNCIFKNAGSHTSMSVDSTFHFSASAS